VEVTPPDPAAILARLQSLRAQRETSAPPGSAAAAAPAQRHAPARPRFRVGERVLCLPYGEGVVAASYLNEHQQEILSIEFAEHGRLDVNPSVSMVRRLEPPPDADAQE
jgi:hypothetical protein